LVVIAPLIWPSYEPRVCEGRPHRAAGPRTSAQATSCWRWAARSGAAGHDGIVTGSSGEFRSWRGGQALSLIQTTAELLPGFSGGPLVDTEGRVIGINSWNFGRGVSRALPVEIAERVAESLRTHGRIRRAYLGIGVQPIRLSEALASQLGQESGLLVVTVEPDGPAHKAGLLQGDTLVTIDGDPLFGRLDGLYAFVRALDVDSTHPFGVIRAGELKEVPVTLGEAPR